MSLCPHLVRGPHQPNDGTEVETEALDSMWLVGSHTGQPTTRAQVQRALPNLGDKVSAESPLTWDLPSKSTWQNQGSTLPSRAGRQQSHGPGPLPEEILGTQGLGLGGGIWTEHCL